LAAAFGLFVYALAFSLAYIDLDAGVGALILFASIQLAMNSIAFFQGQTFTKQALFGIGLAFTGLVVLLLPGQGAPGLVSSLLMMVAALGWTLFLYTGRNNKTPLRDVALAFRWSLLFCIPLIWLIDWSAMTDSGMLLAISSGAVTSGLGYALWYRVLPELGMKNAAQVQLFVPVIAVLLGMLLLGELITLLMLFASGLILVGIGLSIRK
jgi:drug/metabolite transporter (DMT)-like permease